MRARVDVAALLEIDVLIQVAADCSRGKGPSAHLDSRPVRNRTFDRHQPVAQILIDTRSGVTVAIGKLAIPDARTSVTHL
jgi:hypothetical protein